MIVNEKKIDLLALVETRVSRNNASILFLKLGFYEYFTIEGCGFVRGIWIGWKDMAVKVNVVEDNPQFCHLMVSFANERPWMLTIAYVFP